MRYSCLLVYVLILFVSCNQNQATVPDENELFRKEIHAIDWSRVDEYPSYTKCDTILDEEKQRMCFFKTCRKDIKETLLQDSLFVAKKYSQDSLLVKVIIFPNGVVELKSSVSLKDMHRGKELDSLLFANSHRLQPIHPAIKRGVPVKSQFEIYIDWKK